MTELCLLPPPANVKFTDREHQYYFLIGAGDWLPVPSSSKIIELSGGKDFDKTIWFKSLLRKGLNKEQAEHFMESTRDIRAEVGTTVHELIQNTLLGKPLHEKTRPPYPEVRAIYEQWKAQIYPRIGRVFIIEQSMVHPTGLYGFTPDLVAEIDGVLCLADWKTVQAAAFVERYQWLAGYRKDDALLAECCSILSDAAVKAGVGSKKTARVREGWQMQQGSYAYGLIAVHRLGVQRGINFMLSVDGVSEHRWNIPDLRLGWLGFVNGLLRHHDRSGLNSSHGHQSFAASAQQLRPLLSPGRASVVV